MLLTGTMWLMFNGPQVCLVGGTGRSGTTILSSIFARHPGVVEVPELRYLVDPDGLLDIVAQSDTWSPVHHEVRIRRLRAVLEATKSASPTDRALTKASSVGRLADAGRKIWPAYGPVAAADSLPGYEAAVEKLLDDLTDFSWTGDWMGMPMMAERTMPYLSPDHNGSTRTQAVAAVREFLQTTMTNAATLAGATHYLEKNTWNILHFGRILEVVPDARLVHIVRDPRDTVASYLQQRWAPNTARDAARYFHDLHAEWTRVARTVPAELVLEVRLEDLVADPSATLHNICEHWTLPWSEQLLSTPLNASNSGRWQAELGDDPIVFELLAPTMSKYGYE